MKAKAVRATTLLTAALSIAVIDLQAAPSLPITEPPVISTYLDGPPSDPGSTNGQWFLDHDGTEEFRPREFHDNLSGFGGGNMQHLAIEGKVVSVTTNAAGQITAFNIDAFIHNDTPSTDGQESSSANSHSESRPAGTEPYIGTLVDTKLTAEFAVVDQATLPSPGAFGHPITPYRWTDPLIIAENEDQSAWYCWDAQDPPDQQEGGGWYVPTWDFGDIPTNQAANRLMQFSVSPAMDAADPRHGVIMSSLENGDDVFANRTASLKISTWIDDIGTDFPGPEGMLRDSDVSVFHDIEEEPPPVEYPHKMHWVQYPDPDGWDVRACYTPPTDLDPDGLTKVLADDFLCTSNGFINQIIFWGSWAFDEFAQQDPYQGITNIHLSIHRDVPATEQEYSHPGELLWARDIDPANPLPGWFVEIPVEEEPSLQGWYDPNLGIVEPQNHVRYFRYEVRIPNEEAWYQEEGTTNWLDITVMTTNGWWGWKTTTNHWNDDAVWQDEPIDPALWNELRDPLEPAISLDLAFVINEVIEEEAFDFGDAPDAQTGTGPGNYETVQADNGAYHVIVAGAPFFDDGSGTDQPDGEPDGQPDPSAMGDDNNGTSPDDEDGIVFPAPLVAGQNGSVAITVDDGAGGLGAGGGYVDAWIDFNGDGDWVDAGEQIQNGWLGQGTTAVLFPVPAGATIGQTFARFRITSASTGLPPTGGPAPDGEVEDHGVLIEEHQFDWGDADDGPYPTLSMNSGAHHLIVPGILLGGSIDSELDGQPHLNALGDDNAGIPDDEDGVTFTPLNPIPAQPGQVSVTVVGTGYLNAWFDWANDGGWAQAGDHVYADVPLSTGTYMLNFTTPTNAPWGTQIVTRFRFSSVSNLTYTGYAPDGEVEDHAFTTREPPDHELGDAPDSSNSFATNMTAYPIGGPAGVVAYYPTVYGSGGPAPVGPMHWLPLNQAYLGPAVSREEEADINPDEDIINNIIPLSDQPDNDGDDDALSGSGPLSLSHCRTTTLAYSATWTTPMVSNMFVNVWFDWNRDGDWNDTLSCPGGGTAPEWAVQNHLLPVPSSGPYPKYITDTTPPFTAWHPTANQTPIWMRMTLAEQTWPPKANAAGGEGPTNGYLYGETEDYYITEYEIIEEYDFGDAPDSPYPTLLPGGARHYVTPGFNLGTLIDAETNGQPNTAATGDDLAGVDDEDGVTLGSLIRGSSTAANIVLTAGAAGGSLDAWVDFDADGTWSAGEKIFTSLALSPGSTNLSFSVPVGAALGTNHARFRLSSAGGLSPGGVAVDGEVEDYQVIILQPAPSPDIQITNIYPYASNTAITVEWNAQSNITYQAQSTTNLMVSNSWINVGGFVVGPVNWQTNSAMPTNQFYRIIAPWTP